LAHIARPAALRRQRSAVRNASHAAGVARLHERRREADESAPPCGLRAVHRVAMRSGSALRNVAIHARELRANRAA